MSNKLFGKINEIRIRKSLKIDMTQKSDRNKHYPGRSLIIWSTVTMIVLAHIQVIVTGSDPFSYRGNILFWVQWLPLIPYLIGYWRAVDGKGYPKALFLAGFTGFVGLILIFVLPDKSKEMAEQAGAYNP